MADDHFFNYFINTNTTLINKEVAKKLSKLNLDKICVSIDGSTDKIHDMSRGKKGAFNKCINGIKLLKEENIPIDGVITLSKYNKFDIINILDLLKNLGINNVVIMLLARVGSAYRNVEDCYLTYSELKKIVLTLTQLKLENKIPVNLSIVPAGEGKINWELYLPLKEVDQAENYKLWKGEELDTLEDESYGCTAAFDNLYIDPYGDVYGCSMMASFD